jgi:Arc/MetJ-type ribon-helix-helix transcriptional regulator
MVKTTVYLPDPIKRSLARVAAREGRSEADVIRTAIDEYTSSRARPRPTLPLVEGRSEADLAERFEDVLRGFGED